MFEHFTQSARRVLVLAQEEVQRLSGTSIEPEHLLLGLLREHEGIAAEALSGAGVDYDRSREVIGDDTQRVGSDPAPHTLSGSTMRIIERSVQSSWAQADGGVDTQHLLVALLEEDDETVESVLAALDVTPQEVMHHIDALLAERSP